VGKHKEDKSYNVRKRLIKDKLLSSAGRKAMCALRQCNMASRSNVKILHKMKLSSS